MVSGSDSCIYSGAKKVFSQPPIVQVLPLKNMREACNAGQGAGLQVRFRHPTCRFLVVPWSDTGYSQARSLNLLCSI